MTDRQSATAWALYDWANSAFATTVMAGFFPIFFKQYWSGGQSAAQSTFQLGLANSLASLAIMLLAPVLGAIADKGGAKKGFLAWFTALGVLATAGLYCIAKGNWVDAALLYALASVGFSGAITFYDALLVSVADKARLDRVSALGYALGYLGGGLLFAVNVAMTLKPQWFGLADAAQAVRMSFVSVALWWAVFSLPLFRRVAEPRNGARLPGTAAVAAGWRELLDTLRALRGQRMLLLFLVAYFLYIDGVDTVIRMAVDYGLSLGFDSSSLIVALLITQVVGFPAALVFGRLGERLGARRAIFIGLGVYMAVIVFAYFMREVREFYVLAAVIGLVQGGVQSLSRSLYARIIPRAKAAEFFGLYNMWGKFSVVIGPLLIGWTSLLTGSARTSILAVLVLFVIGAMLLYKVDVAAAERETVAL